MKIALLGQMGRDDAIADRLFDHEISVIGRWENPGLAEKVKQTGGRFHVIDSVTDVELIADITQSIKPDMFLTNLDDALAAGVVDKLKERVMQGRLNELLIPCPDKAGSQVEWDKFLLREIIDKIDPKYNPVNFMATNADEINAAIDYFEQAGIEVAIKPRNLTGGKGVKVMGKHLATHGDARNYAQEVLANADQTGVEIQEKMEGYEFTLQIFTDGTTMIAPPTTFDFPYREDGDTGPGTGGMGSFSMEEGKVMPFMMQEDYDEAMTLMAKILDELKDRGIEYKGMLYPTFFKTDKGLKIVEINARGGDPELINIADLMEDDTDLTKVYTEIANGELKPDSLRYKKLASTVIYLVTPEYGYGQGPVYEFSMDPQDFAGSGIKLRYSAARKVGENTFRTIGSSRTLALSALANTPQSGQKNISNAILEYFAEPMKLHFRREIGSEGYISKMRKKL